MATEPADQTGCRRRSPQRGNQSADGQTERAGAALESTLSWRDPARSRDALVRASRVAEAIHVLEEASVGRSASVSGGVAGYEWLRVRDDLAVLYRQVGRTADAERVEAELRTLLALADDDHVVKRRLDALPR